jgi:hypothetical protein
MHLGKRQSKLSRDGFGFARGDVRSTWKSGQDQPGYWIVDPFSEEPGRESIESIQLQQNLRLPSHRGVTGRELSQYGFAPESFNRNEPGGGVGTTDESPDCDDSLTCPLMSKRTIDCSKARRVVSHSTDAR